MGGVDGWKGGGGGLEGGGVVVVVVYPNGVLALC